MNWQRLLILNNETHFINNIRINFINNLFMSGKHNYGIILHDSGKTEYIYDINSINILHYYIKTKNDDDRLIDIIYDAEINTNIILLNMDVVFDNIMLPIFNSLCNLIIRQNQLNKANIYNVSNILDTSIIPNVNVSLMSTIFTEENNNNFDIKLFEYQRKNILKMIDIEKNEISFDRNIEMTIGDDSMIGLLWDPHTETITDKPSITHIKTKGGILADTMGLGKTITMIGLMHYSNNTYVPSDNRINSRATLIIVPPHLANQWVDEYIKAHKNKKKIVVILTKVHHDKTSYDDIINADIVIITISFLLNIKNYGSINCTHYQSHHRNRIIYEYYNELIQTDYLNDKKPLFEFFKFNRIILDEGHEIMDVNVHSYNKLNFIHNFLDNVKADFKWYVSGTPFTSYNGLVNIMKFLNIELNINNKIIKYILNCNTPAFTINNTIFDDLYVYLSSRFILDKVVKSITIRHLKEDVEEHINLLGYKESIEWVELTQSERKIYESKLNKDRILLQQICCHPLITQSLKKIVGSNYETASLEDIEDKLISHHTTIINKYKLKLESLDPSNQAYSMLTKKYTLLINESKFVLNTLEKINEKDITEENCVICYDIMKDPTMTECGHIYCHICINMCINAKPECPMCKHMIDVKKLIKIKSKKQIDTEINPLVAKYGAKLGKMIQMVRQLLIQDARIIIFSQWDDLLLLIRKSLMENEIDCSFISGNVYKRNKAISRFKLGGKDNGVILLSLEHSASGTNLTEASHIFFIEPIDDIKEKINKIESQAISRAVRLGQKQVVEVIRILCKDTIEEEIYKDKYI
jgi:SNF2 family DNA or RNA helicase